MIHEIKSLREALKRIDTECSAAPYGQSDWIRGVRKIAREALGGADTCTFCGSDAPSESSHHCEACAHDEAEIPAEDRKQREALENIVRLGSLNMAGEYEASLRGIISAMTDCAREAVRTSSDMAKERG